MFSSNNIGTVVLTAVILFLCAAISAACNKNDKEALLMFKQDLIDPSNRLNSWTAGSNCCNWTGVVCNNRTGRVLELHLGNPYFPSDDLIVPGKNYEKSSLGGKINPSLQKLRHLRFLDLSGSNFGIEIPKFISFFPNLRFLNLSASMFGGQIPPEFGNLTNLRSLDLHGLLMPAYSDNLNWLSSLRHLKKLDLSEIDMSKASDWLQVVNLLPSLSELRLSYCQLELVPSFPDANFSSLKVLDLSMNQFINPFVPSWIFSLSSLVYLDLSHNNFQGQIPIGLRNLTTSLTYLSLASNAFNSSIPSFIYKFSNLQYLNLASNPLEGRISDEVVSMSSIWSLDVSFTQLQGPLPSSFRSLCTLRILYLVGVSFNQTLPQVLQSLSGCVADGLERLDLSRCQLSGQIPNRIGEFRSLTDLYLTRNSISGPIPKSLASLKSLRALDISKNLLNGTFPDWFGQLPKLEVLWIGKNPLHGVVSESHFKNVTKLRILQASGMSLALQVTPSWVPPFQLGVLDLSSWKLGPRFPHWLQFLKNYIYLDISETQIDDEVPDWFWNLSSQFFNLNMSRNRISGKGPAVFDVSPPLSYPASIDLSFNLFHGELPLLPSNIGTLDLSNNNFSGPISDFLCYKTHEPKSLQNLHIANNHLSGEIPNCFTNWGNLLSVDLKHNKLNGTIPESIGALTSLQSLHLRRNNLSGALPESMENCTGLLALDLSGNSFSGEIPNWIGEKIPNIIIISLGSNNFGGQIPKSLCFMSFLTILDLGHNDLVGKIPNCFGNFTGMSVKQNSSIPISVSFGHFGMSLETTLLMIKGILLEYSTTLRLVTSLDLSDNKLSGQIPEEITSLVGLFSLNLSTNLFSGKIPAEIGEMASLESLDLSYNQVSGEIPATITSLTFLSFLNLAYNNLTGKIPVSTQIQSFEASNFAGNKLCGPPVTANCSTEVGDGDGSGEGENEEEGMVDWFWFWVSLAPGFVVGFWGFVGPLMLNKKWRLAYYGLLGRMWLRINHFCIT